MKYRIQLESTFSNTDANNFLDHMESIKTQVYNPNFYTEVPIVRESKKTDASNSIIFNYTEHENVDFDLASDTHIGVPTGSDFRIKIDVSFTSLTDRNSFLNYIESVKSNAFTTYIRHCRFFDCNHEHKPLIKDGAYSYIDFDGSIVNH